MLKTFADCTKQRSWSKLCPFLLFFFWHCHPATCSRSPEIWTILSSALYIMNCPLCLLFGWYPSFMTLTCLSSLSSSHLVDRRPKFITTFHSHSLAYLIYDSIYNNRCRMPRRPLCLAHSWPAQITTSHSQTIKTVFTYQPLWGCHSVFKTGAQRVTFSPEQVTSLICPLYAA